jgi:hypothetical protein
MAMAVEGKNRHYLWDGIHARHWIETARRCGIADMEAIIADVISRTPAVIERVEATIPKGFPAAIAESILDGVRASSGRLRTELSERTKTRLLPPHAFSATCTGSSDRSICPTLLPTWWFSPPAVSLSNWRLRPWHQRRCMDAIGVPRRSGAASGWQFSSRRAPDGMEDWHCRPESLCSE